MMTLPTLAPEIVGHFGSFPISNTFIGSLGTLVVVVLLALAYNRVAIITHILDLAGEGLLTLFDQATKSRELSLSLFPFVGGIFLFILLSNWLGLMPGVGSLVVRVKEEGHLVNIPIFRGASTDLNLTLALSLVAVILSHIVGILAIGFFKYVGKFVQLGAIFKALKSLSPIAIFAAFVEGFVGILEAFSEAAKVLSLSLRLFGNVFAGEVLLTVMSGLFAYALPLPFIALELLVGVVQATVFAMLVIVYFSIALSDPHGANQKH